MEEWLFKSLFFFLSVLFIPPYLYNFAEWVRLKTAVFTNVFYGFVFILLKR